MTSQFRKNFRLLALPVILGLALIVGVFWFASVMTAKVQAERDRQVAIQFREEVNNALLKVQGALTGTVALWKSSDEVRADEFATYMGYAFPSAPGLLAIEYVDAGNVIRYAYPLDDETMGALGTDIDVAAPARLSVIAAARAADRPVVTAPVFLSVGQPGLVSFHPINMGGRYVGQVAGTVRFRGLLADVDREAQKLGYSGFLRAPGFMVPFDGNTLYTDSGRCVISVNGDTEACVGAPQPRAEAVVSPLDVGGQVWELVLYRQTPSAAGIANYYAYAHTAVVLLFVALFIILRRRHGVLQEALNREREFVSIVSHQLREPLTKLSWSCDIMLEDESIPVERRCQVTKMHEIVRRAVRLTNDLLNVSRLERDVLPINLEDLPLATLVEDVMAVLREAAEHKRITINLTLPSGLNVMVDRVKAAEAIRNIVDNAVKYAPEGSSVDLVAVANQGQVQLAVADHGPGIPEAIRQSFFERSSSAVKRGNGTGAGLGMYLTKMFIEKMGGRVSFKTSEKGTTFLVTLPMAENNA
jgi:signal transduction histidine kinase